MKIVLVEERAGQPYPEREFTSEVIKIGRDPIESHLVFDQAEWPMVSRRHAEFRLRDGRCLVADTGSKFGTFVDGQRVDEPREIRVGARVQFGSARRCAWWRSSKLLSRTESQQSVTRKRLNVMRWRSRPRRWVVLQRRFARSNNP